MRDRIIRILLVEDNPADATLLQMGLEEAEQFQFELSHANSLLRAEVLLKNYFFDVILLDLGLPDTHGQDTVKRVKKQVPDLPIVVLTGAHDKTTAIEAIQAGAQDCLTKGEVGGAFIAKAIHSAIERQKWLTKNKQVEDNLRSSEERFRQVVSSISDHIYVSRIKEGKYLENLYLSPHVVSLTGYPLEKFSQDWAFWPSKVIHPDDRAIAAYQMQQLLQGNSHEVEYRLVRADGEIIWVRDSARVEAENQNNKLVYGVVSNITERKQLIEQLHQAHKMEAVGRLASGVAHDYNNILTIVIGNCDLLLENDSLNENSQTDVKQIKDAALRATPLISQLLTLGRQQNFQPKAVNLNEIVTQMEQILQRLVGKDILLKMHLDKNIGTIKADPNQLEQVIMNLVINARDAMPEGGELTIETNRVHINEDFAKHYFELMPGSYIRLMVNDTGFGMDIETQSRVFEPYFTTKSAGKGTGLGLAIVHGIVKQNGGQIFLSSKPHQGTTFQIFFPQPIDQTLSKKVETDWGTQAYLRSDQYPPESPFGQAALSQSPKNWNSAP